MGPIAGSSIHQRISNNLIYNVLILYIPGYGHSSNTGRFDNGRNWGDRPEEEVTLTPTSSNKIIEGEEEVVGGAKEEEVVGGVKEEMGGANAVKTGRAAITGEEEEEEGIGTIMRIGEEEEEGTGQGQVIEEVREQIGLVIMKGEEEEEEEEGGTGQTLGLEGI
uniref:Uncharacterized protein n=1 Tax=Amphimedon queenslandica TaxID=400682 RepID=A0A1X7U364_AMPQE